MLPVQSMLNDVKKRKDEENWLPKLHHILMKEYGWIPYEEFKQLPLPMLWQLVEQIEEQHEAEREAMEKVRRK